MACVAQDQAGQVAGEVKNQAKDLLHQTKSELTDQASTQQKRVASGLRALGDELGSMAQSSESQGMATDLVRQAADRTGSIAAWLDDREPGHVLDEVTSFARRRPGAFLALAAGAGLLAGRLGRGLMTDPSPQAEGRSPQAEGRSKPESGTRPPSAPQTPSQARRIVPAAEQFDQYSNDVDGGNVAPPPTIPAQRPFPDPDYTTQPGYGARSGSPATGIQP